MASLRKQILALADEFEPQVSDAFLAAVDDIRDQAQITAIAKALDAGNVDRALELVGIDPVAFRGIDEQLRNAFNAGGAAAVRDLPTVRDSEGAKLVIRFDGRNQRAEQYLSEHSSTLISRIVADQMVAVRGVLQNGLSEGRNPKSVALDIVGRIDRQSGRRIGGIVGLTSGQARAVASARAELESGQYIAYLDRTLRDRRFDAAVIKASKNDTALPADTISKAVGRYSDRLLLLRGKTIARTETIGALNRSQVEAVKQAVDKGMIRAQDVRKVWVATMDDRTRDSHAHINGESVGLDEAFSNGLQYPGDPAGGPAETVNCRCSIFTRVDFLSNYTD